MGRSRNQTDLIPDRLLSDVKKGDRVLFLGADLPLEYPNAPLSRPEMAAALAERYDLPRGKSWPQTATAYLSTFHNDRHGLVTFVREHGYGPQVAPSRSAEGANATCRPFCCTQRWAVIAETAETVEFRSNVFIAFSYG